jgi:nondiscriminating aspartyl-tRNA synthetase
MILHLVNTGFAKYNKFMKRTLTSETIKKVGEEIILQGWVNSRRDHGKIMFLDLRDRKGIVQIVSTKVLADVRPEYVIEVVGLVKKRPESMVNPKIPTGTVEIEAKEIKILAAAAPLPFDMGGAELNLELPTLLDHRALTLRHPKVQAIFRIQAVVIDAFREFMKSQDFMEFQAPSITPAVAEGGAEVFEVDYFGHKAYLTQSPQLYKQIVMTAFERVFSVNKIFRAEPSVTTRHLTEVVSLDAEMCFIESWKDIRDMADSVVRFILAQVAKDCQKELSLFTTTLPAMIEKTPTISLREAQQKIFEKKNRDVRGQKDLNPEDERDLCEIIKEETGSDFVFVYGYPTKKKPFYVYPSADDPEYNEGMDLLCRGVEWLSGGRRINDYDQLMAHVKEWNMDPEKISMFLEAFKYGVPPEGGFAFGAERITMQLLGLQNIREATMFPRDMERIDERLSRVSKSLSQDEVYAKIIAMLKENSFVFESYEHVAVKTSEDAARVRNTPLHEGAKALVMYADDAPIMMVLPADVKADLTTFKHAFHVRDLRMATPDEVKKVTGVPIGAVPPFGHIFNIPLYMDEGLRDNTEIVFNAGLHTKSVRMAEKDFEKIAHPTTGKFSKQP